MPKRETRSVPSLRLPVDPTEMDAMLAGMRRVLASGQLTLGTEGKQLEEEFARFVGVPFACAVNSGTSALEIPLRAFNVEGKEVLVPTNTFFATPAAVAHAGGIPRFVDCDPRTLSLDVESVKRRWTKGCAGVIAVHIGGAVAPCIQGLRELCRERGMFLLEDAAHAHGSTLAGRRAGSFSDAASFSFYPTKVMTSGEGGMIVTSDERLYKEALMYRDQGKESFSTNFHVRMGYNWRMSELHAVVGRSQLRQLSGNLAKRREIARWYDQLLANAPGVTLQSMSEGSESNYYKYPVFLPDGVSRAEIKKRLKAEWQVSLSGEVYEVPCHKQPVFSKYVDASLPGAEWACARHVCLPLYPDLKRDEAEYVVEAFLSTLRILKTEGSH